MGLYGFLWVFMVLFGFYDYFLCVLMRLYGFLLVLIRPYVSLCVPLNLYSSLWIVMCSPGLYKSLCVLVDSNRTLFVLINHYKFL